MRVRYTYIANNNQKKSYDIRRNKRRSIIKCKETNINNNNEKKKEFINGKHL